VPAFQDAGLACLHAHDRFQFSATESFSKKLLALFVALKERR
jgi:hypothetical protein